jgi:hypothetical protein
LVDAWPYGPLYVLEALWQRLGLADIIAAQLAVYLSPADKYLGLTRQRSQGQKGLEERAIMASQWLSEPW